MSKQQQDKSAALNHGIKDYRIFIVEEKPAQNNQIYDILIDC